MNSVNLIGNAGADPELRYFESGAQKATFNIAVCRAYAKDGQPDTDWFSVECWGKTAEIAANYIKKGKQVAVSGSIQIESWEDRQSGQKRSKPVVKVDRLTLLGKRDSSPQLDGDDLF